MLLYAWFEQINQMPFNNGINFIGKFDFDYHPTEKKLILTENDKFIPNFYGKNINDIRVLVGENGVGKTQLCKHLFRALSNPTNLKDGILIYMSKNNIYIQNGEKAIHTIIFEQSPYELKNGNKEIVINQYTLYINQIADCKLITPFFVTNAFAPIELGHSMQFEPENYRSPAYCMQKAIQWEQKRYGIQMGEYIHNNSSIFANAKTNSVLTEYQIYQNRLFIANYLTADNIPIFKKVKIYNEFTMNIRPFEGEIPSAQVDRNLKEECINIADKFRSLKENRTGILENAYILLLEETYLYFPGIRKLIEIQLSKWKPTDTCIIEPKFNDELLNLMQENISKNKQTNPVAGKWKWLEQIEGAFKQLEKWQNTPKKKDLFQYKMDTYKFENENGRKLLDFYYELLKKNDDFWKRTIGFNLNSASSGEIAAINLFSYITDIFLSLNQIQEESTFFIIIDEIDIGLHPKWQQQILQYLVEFLEQKFTKYNFQILITSHSPIFLSDIPNDKVYQIKMQNNIMQMDVCKNTTFGANIYNLFYDGFFMDEGTIGTFSQKKINNVISWLSENNKNKISQDEVEYIINSIGEPVVKENLRYMFKQHMSDS